MATPRRPLGRAGRQPSPRVANGKARRKPWMSPVVTKGSGSAAARGRAVQSSRGQRKPLLPSAHRTSKSVGGVGDRRPRRPSAPEELPSVEQHHHRRPRSTSRPVGGASGSGDGGVTRTSRARLSKSGGGGGGGGGGGPAEQSPPRGISGEVSQQQSSRIQDAAISQRIEELQEQCEYYTKRIEVERRRSEELDKKLKISRLKMAKVRNDTGNLDDVGSQVNVQRKLAILEHRLDKMSVRLNQARNKNKGMKLTIEDLRRERMQRENIKKKLEREVKATKRSMLATIQESQAATDARDKAERLAAELEHLISSEMVAFEAAFQKRMNDLELERQQHEHRKHAAAAAAAATAAAATTGLGEEEEAALTAQLDDHGLPFKGEMTIAQEQELKHRSTKAVWEVVKREVDLKAQAERLQTFDNAFQRIKANTGIQTIDEMVAEFCDAEDHNFSLINIINGLNKEVEQLEVQNADMEYKLRSAKGKGQESEHHRNQIFSALETQIAASEKKARWYNHKHDEAMKAIFAIKGGILSIFEKVGCQDESMLENVAATGVTDTNLMKVLGIVEQRIAEIVQMNELALGRLGKQPERRSLSKLQRADTSLLPSTLESDDDDDGDVPLSLAALKARTAHVMNHKIARGAVQLPIYNAATGAPQKKKSRHGKHLSMGS